MLKSNSSYFDRPAANASAQPDIWPVMRFNKDMAMGARSNR
jgi:hypothetical protein